MSSFGGGAATPSPEDPSKPVAQPAPEPPPAEPEPPPAEPDAPPAPSAFLSALAELLGSRGLDVPPGLLEAPAEAYAGHDESLVPTLARLRDGDLAERARKIAGWQARQAERAERAWETSPLIAEVRRRALAEPPRPERVVGAAFSVKKPLAEWTDEELQEAVAALLRLAGG